MSGTRELGNVPRKRSNGTAFAAPHLRRAREFLRIAHLYRLGSLPTEQPHPETRDLSRWARRDLPKAVSTLKGVDLRALTTLEEYADGIDRLATSVQATLSAGRRVFLGGCGATGRLSLSLESLWRRRHPGNDQVRSFMAGGDVALVHSLEGFEDRGGYGARHVDQSGFEDGDLLIACTEGGETPYVIGATERAAEISSIRPFFLYCNPDAELTLHVERFRKVRDNPRIRKLCLAVGPMALAGSTRMQASTVLQLAVGLALFRPDGPVGGTISRYRDRVEGVDFSFLVGLVEEESGIYASGQRVVYRVGDYGITVFTDTTERAPTFSLAPFGRPGEVRPRRSLCRVALEGTDGAARAWERLLSRRPRALNWPEVDPRTTDDYLYGFDFSRGIGDEVRRAFRVLSPRGRIAFRLSHQAHDVDASDLPEHLRHLLLKQMLNIHSTLVMGRLGRFEGNLMTWVSPTNGKLIDRAARYVQHLLVREGRASVRYEDVVRRLFAEMDTIRPDESVVLKTLHSLLRSGTGLGRGRGTARPLLARGSATPILA